MIEKDKDKLFDRESAQGSVYDKMYFTDDQLKQGEAINQKAAAGEITWDSAHNWWENTRAGHGYSGGEDGHGYTALGDFSSDNILPYEDKYSAQTGDLLGKIMNREPFSYDPANDPLYQQYADSYTRMGKQAMEDTLAQISARTGGLASSYAGTASQQTYDRYMAALADKVPELRQQAYQQYVNEGNDMRQDLNLLQQLEAIAYDRYRDQVVDNQWQQNYDRGVFEADRNFNYGVSRDGIADERWQIGYDDSRNDAAKSDAQARIGAYLAAYGSVAELDPALVSASGYTQAELTALEKYYADLRAQEQGVAAKPGGGGNPLGDGNPVVDDDVPGAVMERVQSITNQDELATYLDGLTAGGVISADQADKIYATYLPNDELPAISARKWSVVDDGGTNWGWGVDNNAIVKDQYGNEYRLDRLVDALIGSGMSKSEAKAYVKNLQKQLGI